MKNKILMYSGAVLALVALIFALYKPFLKWKQERDAAKLMTETMEGEKIKPGTATFPLKKGKSGIEVLYWQAYLNVFKGATIETLDGIWGNETERENNDHHRQSSISQPEYSAYVLVNYMQLTTYLNSKKAIK